MKVAVIILVMLGLLAAGSAVVLVQAMKFNAGGQELPTVDVLVAQADLPARTRITGENVMVKPSPKGGLPQGYLVDPSQAIGKVLKLAVAKGQPIAESCFMTKTSVDDLLRPGMLAFQIPLSRSNTAVDLLYDNAQKAKEILDKSKPRMTKEEYLQYQRNTFRTELFEWK